MQRRFLIRLATAILGSTALFAGCNIFNPTGEDHAGSNLNGNALGEQRFRQRDFAGAMSAFEQAIAADSNNSMAYYGYAKSAVRRYNLNINGVLQDLDSSKNGSALSFLNHDDVTLTARLQAAVKVNHVLGVLTDRDTLTGRFNRYLKGDDSADFMKHYLDSAVMGKPGFRKSDRFPLTDFAMPYKKVLVDFTAFKVLYNVTRLYDLDQNDIIDSRDALMKKLKFGKSGGGLTVDSLSSIRGDLESDPVARQNLNSLIQSVYSGFASASQLASLIGIKNGKSDSGKDSSTSGNINKVIGDLGDAITFYQFGDGRDNDGDGCVDEEIMDGRDNDGDGFVDEDANLLPGKAPDDTTLKKTIVTLKMDTVAIPPTSADTFKVVNDSIVEAGILKIVSDTLLKADTNFQVHRIFQIDTVVRIKTTITSTDSFTQTAISSATDSLSIPPDTIFLNSLPIGSILGADTLFLTKTTFSTKATIRSRQIVTPDTTYRMDTIITPNPLLGFARSFKKQFPDSQFVKIKKGDPNFAFRLQIQKDSLLVKMAGKSYAQLNGTAKAQLDSAAAWIGGCWRDYIPASLPKKSRGNKP